MTCKEVCVAWNSPGCHVIYVHPPRCCLSHHQRRPIRTRRSRHPPPTTLHPHGTSCVLRRFHWIMCGITAAPACSQHSVGMHLLFPADVPAQSLSCYALECSGGEADNSLVRASPILPSAYFGDQRFFMRRWQSQASRLCCQRHLRLVCRKSTTPFHGSCAALVFTIYRLQ